jgi:3'(2'), 5'-bisphosphate nucleotidase
LVSADLDMKVICSIAREAGEAIMGIYDGDHAVEYKDDKSPLTAADKASHEVIVAGLQKHFPEIPILSEEGAAIPYEERKNWQHFWLVDPLDGTKEFIKHNGEFTVNLALIEEQKPVLGVVYVPAQERLYYGVVGKGAFVEIHKGDEQKLEVKPIHIRKPDFKVGLTVVMSRSHPSPELEAYLKNIKVAEALPIGSSLKLCAVAEGQADLYPRLGPTMEWDTAAAHAVAVSAGAKVVNYPDGEPLRYNKEDLLNPFFIVAG